MLLCPLTGLLLLGVETVKEKGGMQRMKSWDVSVIKIVVVSDSPLNQRMKDEEVREHYLTKGRSRWFIVRQRGGALRLIR